METMLARNWWILALRGVFAIVFGLLTWIWPGITLLVLITIFGAYALIDGIFAVIAGVAAYGHNNRWWEVLLEGLVGIIFGGLTILAPDAVALVLAYVIAGWALVTGILEIAAAIRLRKVINNEWFMIISGIASVIFGIILAIAPGVGAISITLLIGIYAIVFGILFIILALRLRNLPQAPSDFNTTPAARM